ncbi:MAG: hypothetical protein KJ630_21570 [Proteobacteria bacterium]|nr:hypothetical protein [Pseudomonadota bacterium]
MRRERCCLPEPLSNREDSGAAQAERSRMLVVVGLFDVVFMVMLMRSGAIRFMLVVMGGTIAVVRMVMIVLEGVGVIVMVMVPVIMLFFAVLVCMIVIMVVVMAMGVLVRVFALAHSFLPFWMRVVYRKLGIRLPCNGGSRRERTRQA